MERKKRQYELYESTHEKQIKDDASQLAALNAQLVKIRTHEFMGIVDKKEQDYAITAQRKIKQLNKAQQLRQKYREIYEDNYSTEVHKDLKTRIEKHRAQVMAVREKLVSTSLDMIYYCFFHRFIFVFSLGIILLFTKELLVGVVKGPLTPFGLKILNSQDPIDRLNEELIGLALACTLIPQTLAGQLWNVFVWVHVKLIPVGIDLTFSTISLSYRSYNFISDWGCSALARSKTPDHELCEQVVLFTIATCAAIILLTFAYRYRQQLKKVMPTSASFTISKCKQLFLRILNGYKDYFLKPVFWTGPKTYFVIPLWLVASERYATSTNAPFLTKIIGIFTGLSACSLSWFLFKTNMETFKDDTITAYVVMVIFIKIVSILHHCVYYLPEKLKNAKSGTFSSYLWTYVGSPVKQIVLTPVDSIVKFITTVPYETLASVEKASCDKLQIELNKMNAQVAAKAQQIKQLKAKGEQEIAKITEKLGARTGKAHHKDIKLLERIQEEEFVLSQAEDLKNSLENAIRKLEQEKKERSAKLTNAFLTKFTVVCFVGHYVLSYSGGYGFLYNCIKLLRTGVVGSIKGTSWLVGLTITGVRVFIR